MGSFITCVAVLSIDNPEKCGGRLYYLYIRCISCTCWIISDCRYLRVNNNIIISSQAINIPTEDVITIAIYNLCLIWGKVRIIIENKERTVHVQTCPKFNTEVTNRSQRFTAVWPRYECQVEEKLPRGIDNACWNAFKI